jgi:hypothetical protein
MMVWGNLNGNFNQATMGYDSPSPSGATWDLTGGIYTSLGWKRPGLVVYQESHDEERLMYNNEQYGNSAGTYMIRDTTTGLARNEMATAFWALMPGPKMVWQFGELGYDYSINYCLNGRVDPSGTCRLDPKPVRWDYLQKRTRKKLHDVYAGMFQLRGNFAGLDTGSTTYSLGGAFKSMLVSSPDLHAVVIGNFDVRQAGGSATFSQTGTWYDYFGGDSISVSSTPQTFTLAPGEFHVYLDKKVFADTAQKDTLPQSAPSGLAVRIFPNPVIRNSSTIEYDLPQDGSCDISIVNSLGQNMARVQLGNQLKGKHQLQPGQLPLNFSLFPSGVYVIRISSNNKVAHSSFLILP